MNRILHKLIVFGVLLFVFPKIAEAQVSFKAEAPRVVSMNEMFQLSISSNIDLNSLELPDLSDFRLVTNVRSINSINGRATYSIILGLVPKSEGKFEIKEMKLTDKNGNIYKTNPIHIEVISGESTQNQGTTNAQVNSQSGGDPQTDIFVQIIPSRTTLYRGDNLTVAIKVYRKPQVQLSGYENFKLPTYNGFWSKDLDVSQSWQRENINGKIYETMILKRNILYPQQAGILKIEPFEATWIIRKSTGRQSFFFDDYDEVRKTTKSPVVTINVKNLPENAPKSFTGAVGKFNMTASLSKNKITANDALSLNVKISGDGNLSLIGAPKPIFPHDFESFDSKKTEQVNGVMFEYPLIPRSAGRFTIDPVEFSYFDPNEGRYTTLTSNPMLIEVEKDPNAANQISVIGNRNQRDVKIIGSDIHFIKSKNDGWRKKDTIMFGLKHMYPIYITLILIFVLFYLYLNKRHKDSKNIILVRNKKARRIAKKRLKISEELMKLNSQAGFYEELLKAIWGYIGDKFSLPLSELSRNNVCGMLAEKDISGEDVNKLIEIIDECEFARYAPGKGNAQMQQLYDSTIEIISKLEQKTK